MGWEIYLSPVAESDLAKLPLPLQSFVEAQLDKLAQDPVNLSRKASFPFVPRGQIYQFSHPSFDGRSHFFTVLFHYGQDEKSLEVLGIGHQ